MSVLPWIQSSSRTLAVVISAFVVPGVACLLLVGVAAGGSEASGEIRLQILEREDYRPPVPLGLDLYLPVPEDNPLTREKVVLGERLFFDPRLSRDGSMTCASCHIPDRAFADSLPVATGIEGRRGTRSAPPLINLAWASFLFRDGRAVSLEEQALHPIQAPTEMDLPLTELERRLRADPSYRSAFREAFPDEDAPGPSVSTANVARALASYVRTILAGDAPFDRFLSGNREAVSEEARRGFRLFTGKANCSVCHLGPTFSDHGFHNTGAAAKSGDPGRYGATGRDRDRGRFRTPTLREVARTAPYMHDGSLATLEEVIEFYDRGGAPHPKLSRDIRPLSLADEERAALHAFLRSLTGTVEAGVR